MTNPIIRYVLLPYLVFAALDMIAYMCSSSKAILSVSALNPVSGFQALYRTWKDKHD